MTVLAKRNRVAPGFLCGRSQGQRKVPGKGFARGKSFDEDFPADPFPGLFLPAHTWATACGTTSHVVPAVVAARTRQEARAFTGRGCRGNPAFCLKGGSPCRGKPFEKGFPPDPLPKLSPPVWLAATFGMFVLLAVGRCVAQPVQGTWDFETPDQAAWHFLIETGKGELRWDLAGPEAGPHSGQGCLRVDFRFGGEPENHLKLEWYRERGAWDLRDYVGLEVWVKPLRGASHALRLSHWFNDGGHWWHYRARGWDDLQDDRWNRLTLAFDDGVEYFGPDANYDPTRTTQFILVFLSRAGFENATGTVYIDDIRLIEKPGVQPRYRPKVGVWFVAAFKPDEAPNRVLNWRLPKMLGLRPKIGYYDSADPEVIRWQLAGMRRAGIDFLVIDVPPLDPLPAPVRAVLAQLRAQPQAEKQLQYCFQLEVYGQTPSAEVLRTAADRIWQECGADPLYFRYKGKPLLIAFAASEAPRERWEDERFTVRWISPAPGDWKYFENFPQSANRECMCVSPGACNLLEYLCAPHVVGQIFSLPREGGAFLARQLKWALDNQPDIIFVSSWNDWAFGNTIEPSDEYGETCLDIISEMLETYAGARVRAD